MGEEQRGTWQELVARNREAFESGTDLTLAVEEEFALLDPETLELTNRFESLKEAADQTEKQNCPPGINAKPKLDLRVLLNDLLQPPLLPACA